MPIYSQRMDIYQNTPKFVPFRGRITSIEDLDGATAEEKGCSKRVMVEGAGGQIIQFTVNQNTYFVDGIKIDVDSVVTVFYNENIPVMLIYPPQLEALVIALDTPGQNVKLDIFNDILVSSDGSLQLTLGQDTEIISENGQNFYGKLTQRPLLAVYGAATRSIPAQTTPDKIVIMCSL